MATLRTYSQDYSDAERLRNIENATGGPADENYISSQTIQGDPVTPQFGFNTTPTQEVGSFTQSLEDAYGPSQYPTTYDPQNEINAQAIRFGTTVGDSLAGIQTEEAEQGTQGTFTPGGFEEYEESDPFDEDAARRQATRNQLRLYQAEIDATNRIYDEQLNQARLAQTGRLGSQRSVAARGGLLGSSFGSAQKEKVTQYGVGIERGIQAERAAKIGNIMGTVRQSVVDEMAERREAYQLGADAVIANIAGRSARKQENINQFAGDLIAQGFDITDLSDEELQQFATEAGVTTDDLVSGYARAKASLSTEEETGKDFTLSQGQQRFDSEGNLIAGVDKTYAPTGGTGGTGGTGINVDGDDFDLARQFIQDNPNASLSEIRTALLENTDLSVTEINSIMESGGIIKEELPLTQSQIGTTANAIRKAMAKFGVSSEDELQAAIDYVEEGTITTKGKTYNLTNSQIDALVTELENLGPRTTWESVLPGGN